MGKKNMTGQQFEEYCAGFLKKRGFKKVRITKASGDQGVDILAKRRGRTYAIQCKLYRKPVGNSAVQEAYAGMQYYGCDRALVMTNSTFTKGARELAESTGVELWEEIPLRRGVAGKVFLLLLIIAAICAALYLTQQTAV